MISILFGWNTCFGNGHVWCIVDVPVQIKAIRQKKKKRLSVIS